MRALERDHSFIKRYLTEDLCKEMNLFEYKKRARDYIISEVSDENGWREIRDTFASSVGMGSVPLIRVVELAKKDNTLIFEHVYDGRELELNYANETIKYLVDLWEGKVMISTFIDNSRKVIICDEKKKVTMVNA